MKFVCFFAAFLCANTCFAQEYKLRVVADTNIQKILPKNALTNNFVADSTACIQKVNELVQTFQAQGYLSAGVDTIFLEKKTLVAKLFLGKKYHWHKINLANLDAKLIAATNIRLFFENNAINSQNYQKICTKILAYCASTGYPFATVGLQNLNIKNDSISGSLVLDKRIKITLDSIRISGSTKVSRQYLEKYLSLPTNQPYNAAAVANIERRLANLPFLRSVQPPKTYFYNDRATIYIFVKDIPINQADGIIGVFPNAQNSNKLLVTGDVTLSLQNSFRHGELLSMAWKRLDANVAELKLKGNYPFLAGLPLGIEGEFRQFRRDTSQFELNQRYGVQFFFDGSNFVKAYWQKKDFTLNNGAFLASDSNRIASSLGSLYGVEWRIQRLNRVQNPTRGYSLSGSVGLGSKKTRTLAPRAPNLTTKQTQIELQASVYLPLSKRWVLATMVQAQGNFNTQIFENELFRLGGFKTLKGFEEESLRASRYLALNIEPRFLLEQNAYLFGFFNAAYLENQYTRTRTKPLGFGLGMNFAAKNGIFSIAYALGKNSSAPLLVRSSKIHFGYKYFL